MTSYKNRVATSHFVISYRGYLNDNDWRKLFDRLMDGCTEGDMTCEDGTVIEYVASVNTIEMYDSKAVHHEGVIRDILKTADMGIKDAEGTNPEGMIYAMKDIRNMAQSEVDLIDSKEVNLNE